MKDDLHKFVDYMQEWTQASGEIRQIKSEIGELVLYLTLGIEQNPALQSALEHLTTVLRMSGDDGELAKIVELVRRRRDIEAQYGI
jgi:hypothetical protein